MFDQIIQTIDSFVWGIPLIVLILGVGIYLTVRLVFLPIRKLVRAFKYMFEKEEGEGEVSSFGALCTALSATIGTGNIVGVATAIAAGGPGGAVLDVAGGLLRHGHKVCRRPPRRQIPQGIPRRAHPRRDFRLY